MSERKVKIVEEGTRCVEIVHEPGRGSWSHQCYRKGKVKRGKKWYCTIHDPIRIEAKQKERSAKFDAKWASRDAADKRERDTKRVGKQLANTTLRYHICGELADLAKKYIKLSQESANQKGGR